MNCDIRIINSMKLIINAYVSLLEDEDDDQVKISHICRKAGVSRPTFYNNYRNKDDLLLKYLNYLIKRYFEILSSQKYSFEESITLFYWICDKQKAFMKVIINKRLDRSFIDSFASLMKEYDISDTLLSQTYLSPNDFCRFSVAADFYASTVYWYHNSHLTYKDIAKMHFDFLQTQPKTRK